MLTSIEFALPNTNSEQKSFNDRFFQLLNIRNFGPLASDPTRLESTSIDLFPKICLQRSVDANVTIRFHEEQTVLTQLNFMHTGTMAKPTKWQVPAFLTLEEFTVMFAGSITGLNHVGINFFTKFMDRAAYTKFKREIAQATTLYNYPTGEEWPFIIPATVEERASEIRDFTRERNPEFEFVYSRYEPIPCIQCDLETSLTKEEVLKRLPKPAGISFEGLEEYMRTVYITHPWGNGLLRFDVRFKDSGGAIYPWLVEQGGRVKLPKDR